ncbi:autotransporter assembly complex family protein [Telmatospirillum sp. J64-1]|uniref:autotransporter assembly complex protein TamA n=1 Tax=Telmatospirillum sp. J64-1 TaxID=2502183 RepID=UPI00163DDFF0|nr:autotransporter assembly complex family protein [Telmatospirillum sp. J64-1]
MPLIRALLAFLVLAFAVSPALAQDVPYHVHIRGVGEELLETIEQNSRLVGLADRPPPSMIALRRRAEEDEERLLDVLSSQGYYAGTVSVAIDESASPVNVTIDVELGPPFILTAYNVHTRNPDPTAQPITILLDALGLNLGSRAIAADIVAAQTRLIEELGRHSYPLARVLDRRAVADFATNTLTVDLTIDTGPFARFGEATISGTTDVAPIYVRRRLTFEENEAWQSDKLEETRQVLAQTGLFAAVRVDAGREMDEEGRLPVAVSVTERPHRTIGGGIGWSTAIGPNAEVFWQHRNLFGVAERLDLAARYSEIRTGFDAAFRKPDLFARNQNLLATFVLEQQNTDAYETRTIGIGGAYEWVASDQWTLVGGVQIEYTRQTDSVTDETQDFTLVSFPTEARRDTTDDFLNPTQGGRFSIRYQPFVDILGSTTSFHRLELADSVYLSLDQDSRYVLAGWASVGTILGAGHTDIPADRRFYVGGGGSVRGYGYQMAGPLNASGDPIGGRSMLAFGSELRMRFGENWGVVPFVEAGSSYVDTYPDLGERLFWGAGLGLRYYTPFGPVRADVAVPLNRRSQDDAFQIYLSLGQAF